MTVFKLRQKLHHYCVLPPALGAAAIAGGGCSFPLVLGAATGHPGFYWASVGALTASFVHPLRGAGVQGMILLSLAGAAAVSTGFQVAFNPWISLLAFAVCGLLLAWLHQKNTSAAKLGILLASCFSIGHAQYGLGNFDNPSAIAMLFLLGGLWVALLGFGLRGLHGYPMWTESPQSLRRFFQGGATSHSRPRHPKRHLLLCLSIALLSCLPTSMIMLPHDYWLTLPVLAGLHSLLSPHLLRSLGAGILLLVSGVLLIALGYSLGQSSLLVAMSLTLISGFRLLQARHYNLFAVQAVLAYLLLIESLTHDWAEPEWRLLNLFAGSALILCSLLFCGGIRYFLKASGSVQDRQDPAK